VPVCQFVSSSPREYIRSGVPKIENAEQGKDAEADDEEREMDLRVEEEQFDDRDGALVCSDDLKRHRTQIKLASR